MTGREFRFSAALIGLVVQVWLGLVFLLFFDVFEQNRHDPIMVDFVRDNIAIRSLFALALLLPLAPSILAHASAWRAVPSARRLFWTTTCVSVMVSVASFSVWLVLIIGDAA